MQVNVMKMKADGEVLEEVDFSGQVMAFLVLNGVSAVIKKEDGSFRAANILQLKEVNDARNGSGFVGMDRSISTDNSGANGPTSGGPVNEKGGSHKGKGRSR